MPKPAVFLDRDGVIIEEVNYLSHKSQVRLIAGALDAIRHLNELGIPVVVVTNQAGVARGLFSERDVELVHAELVNRLASGGARVERFYYCPHHPTAGRNGYGIDCACRKPRPGMLLQAASDQGLDTARSFLIGDKVSDLEAGSRAGCQTVLVRTGHGARVRESDLDFANLKLVGIATDLAEAVRLCLARWHVNGLAKVGQS